MTALKVVIFRAQGEWVPRKYLFSAVGMTGLPERTCISQREWLGSQKVLVFRSGNDWAPRRYLYFGLFFTSDPAGARLSVDLGVRSLIVYLLIARTSLHVRTGTMLRHCTVCQRLRAFRHIMPELT